jgi:NagD protein
MDGVLAREEHAIPGADRFLSRVRELQLPFLVLTNNSIYTRRDLSARLRISGLEVPEDAIWTSALATARFLEEQRPGGSAFVIGEAGLTTALHQAGYTMTDLEPDYVVLGETRTYGFERITHAIRSCSAARASSPPTPTRRAHRPRAHSRPLARLPRSSPVPRGWSRTSSASPTP